MKRLVAIVAIWFLSLSVVGATTYYASTSGSGSTCSVGSPCTISGGISKLTTAGDILEIRAGTYPVDEIRVQNKTGASGNPIIIQGYHYGLSDAERPIITGADTASWTQCSTCDGADNAACPSAADLVANGGSCANFWYFYGTGNQSKALTCVKTDGTPCYRVSTKATMTNAHTNYVTTVCSDYTWIKCNTASDCPSPGATCGSSTAEVDSFSQEISSGYIVARWGAESRGTVIYDNNGNGFTGCNSDWVTIRGLAFRNFRRSHIIFTNSGNGGCSGTSDNDVITDNIFVYGQDTGGSDYQVDFVQASAGTVTNNYFAYSGSESIHTQAHAPGAPTVMTISGNFVRDNGDPNVLGTRGGWPNGTPECMTLSYDGTSAGNDYTGSVLENNLMERCQKNGVILEGSKGWTVRNNIFISTGRTSIKIVDEGNAAGTHEIYNNIFKGCCTNSSGDGSIWVSKPGGGSIDNVKIYHNTFAELAGGANHLNSNNEAMTNILIRDNIFYTSGGTKVINWTSTTAGNIFDYNLVYTSASPAVTWAGDHLSGGTGYTCAQLTNIAAGNINNCQDPLFTSVSLNDFHIPTNSPAKDLATTTGLPSSKTRSINNTIAPAHALPQYNGIPQVGSAWDIGACEYRKRRYYSITEFEWKRPDPWRITNAAFLRLKKEIEN